MTMKIPSNYRVDIDKLPHHFPTQRHTPCFWESLGRAVATFGFLEEVLGKAIFSITATREYNDTEIQQAFNEWIEKLEHALIDPLGSLINTYGNSVRENAKIKIDDLDILLDMLRKASAIRNVLCHGSWGSPDADGFSVPLFVNKKREVFDAAVDLNYINQVQQHAAELACEVINTVTSNGFRFPGSNSPGIEISV
jgi:hypothetical protein